MLREVNFRKNLLTWYIPEDICSKANVFCYILNSFSKSSIDENEG